MAHEIDTTTGRAAMFAAGTPPWHGLGKLVQQALTSREAVTLAGLDWHVEQWELLATQPRTMTMTKARDFVANVRTDTQAVLGVVGRGYQVFQNRDAFDFMDAIVGDKLAMFETAGSLRGGRRVWMLARIPKEYHAGDHDVIKPYVLLVNSHDGSLALRMIPTTVRVVCQNTLNLAMREAGQSGLTIYHRGTLDQRVREARATLGIAAARFDQFDEELHAMLSRHVRSRTVEDYFQGVVPAVPHASDRERANRDEVLSTFRGNFEDKSNTLPGVRGTVWAAYNAVSEWADHQRKFRGKSEQDRQESRLHSAWFGAGDKIKQRAFRSALQLAGMK